MLIKSITLNRYLRMRYSKTVTNEKEATTANLAIDSTVMAKTIVYTFFCPSDLDFGPIWTTFNGIIQEPLPIYSESFLTIAAAVPSNTDNKQTNKQRDATENNTLPAV